MSLSIKWGAFSSICDKLCCFLGSVFTSTPSRFEMTVRNLSRVHTFMPKLRALTRMSFAGRAGPHSSNGLRSECRGKPAFFLRRAGRRERRFGPGKGRMDAAAVVAVEALLLVPAEAVERPVSPPRGLGRTRASGPVCASGMAPRGTLRVVMRCDTLLEKKGSIVCRANKQCQRVQLSLSSPLRTHTTQLLNDARDLLSEGFIKSVQVEVEEGKSLEELFSPLPLSLHFLSFSLQSIVFSHS